MPGKLARTFLTGSILAGCLSLALGSANAQDATAAPTGAVSAPSTTETTAAPGTSTPAPNVPAATNDDAGSPAASLTPPPAYLTGTQGMVTADIEAILANPVSILSSNVPSLISRQVRLLVGSDNRGVQSMIELAKSPDVGFVRLGPIAVGLAQATRGAPPTDIEYGAYIQEAVARSGSEELISAYAAVLQTVEVETASLGSPAGGGGSPGSGSLGGVGAPGISNGFNGDDTVPQTSSPFGSASRGSVAYSGDDDGGFGGFRSDLNTIVQCYDRSPVFSQIDCPPL